jgi:hypothetical protein
MWVCVCVGVGTCGFCNVWVCVCVGVLVICVLVFSVFCIVSFITFNLICFVCIRVRTTSTK